MSDSATPGTVAAAERPLVDAAVARAVVALGFEPILLVDDDRHLLDANDAACALLDRRPAEIPALIVDDLVPPAARDGTPAAWAAFLADGTFRGESAIARPDGSLRQCEMTAQANVRPGIHLVALRDVTDRVVADRELRSLTDRLATALVEERGRADRSETHLLLALGSIPTVVWTLDSSLRYTYVSQFRHGLTPEAMIGRTDAEVFPGPGGVEMLRLKRGVLTTGVRQDAELEVPYPDGPRVMQFAVAPLRDATGEVVGVLGATTDITSFREAERAAARSQEELERLVEARAGEVARSERQLRELIDGIDAVVGFLGEDADTVRHSSRLRDMLGYDPAAPISLAQWRALIHPEDRPAVEAAYDSRETDLHLEYRVRHADGHYVWIRDRLVRHFAPDGSIVGLFFVLTDVTALREAEAEREAAVVARERLYRDLIEGQDAILWVAREDASDIYMSPQVEGILGVPAERWYEPGFWETLVHPDDLERARAALTSHDELAEVEYRALAADGRVLWFRDRIRTVRDETGTIRKFGLTVDVTALRVAEAELRAREAQYRGLVEMQDAFFWEEDLPGHAIRYMSPQVERLTGFPPAAFRRDVHFWRSIVHPEDRERIAGLYDELHEGSLEYRVIAADGRVLWMREHATVLRDADGRPTRLIGVAVDITALRRVEEEREATVARVRELARLEALARTAATTAHDFTNVLLGIDVFAGFLAADPTLGERARADVERIRAAVESGRAFASALVSLGRLGAAKLAPTDVNEAILALRGELAALLGPRVALTVDAGAAHRIVEIDGTALERALVNLVVNAGDAIVAAGQVRIATEDVEEDDSSVTVLGIAHEGRYLSISVTDDGAGMDEATLERAFEPYFTTKPVGQGTGLGLSSVHALVRAVDGHVHAASVPGRGSTFRICIPAAP